MDTGTIIASGGRKEATARVRLVPGTGIIMVNGRTAEQHFPRGPAVIHPASARRRERRGAL